MPSNENQYIEQIANFLKEKIGDRNVVSKLALQLYKGARDGLEIDVSFEDWFDNTFKYQFVWLSKDDYVKALVRALWLAPVFAGSDFGSSRQRDMGQVWTDTARGFLGEIALSKFLIEKFDVDTKLDTRRGDLAQFLPTDIAEMRKPNDNWKKPALKISTKTSKFNARWLDLPGKQFDYSDVFILVKLGILRQHFLAFLKAISFLKDKLFVTAKDLGELDEESASTLWDEIPEFETIPAYVPGFIHKSEINLPIHMICARKKGRKHIRISITQGIGLFSPSTVRDTAEIHNLDPDGNLPIEIDPIIESLTSTHFFAHSGGLKHGERSWKQLVNIL